MAEGPGLSQLLAFSERHPIPAERGIRVETQDFPCAADVVTVEFEGRSVRDPLVGAESDDALAHLRLELLGKLPVDRFTRSPRRELVDSTHELQTGAVAVAEVDHIDAGCRLV